MVTRYPFPPPWKLRDLAIQENWWLGEIHRRYAAARWKWVAAWAAGLGWALVITIWIGFYLFGGPLICVSPPLACSGPLSTALELLGLVLIFEAFLASEVQLTTWAGNMGEAILEAARNAVDEHFAAAEDSAMADALRKELQRLRPIVMDRYRLGAGGSSTYLFRGSVMNVARALADQCRSAAPPPPLSS
ncbi:MAG: hypothetical protein KGI89_08745 [Euryarchaeota archaeon]|nr:hypothetical protein [Euryarchaeota archaeon]